MLADNGQAAASAQAHSIGQVSTCWYLGDGDPVSSLTFSHSYSSSAVIAVVLPALGVMAMTCLATWICNGRSIVESFQVALRTQVRPNAVLS